MRIAPLADDLIEWVALRLNLAPVPVAASVYGMPAARTLAVAQRLGLLSHLARTPATAAEVARALALEPVPTRLLLETLEGARHLTRRRDGRYALHRRARRWLDPASSVSVLGYLDHTADYWAWWADLERIVREGGSFAIHAARDDDPSWRRYITGQHELARLSADEVARAIELPAGSARLLDLGGGHGTFAAALCRRYPGLEATVLDLAGSAAIGRELNEERVAFRTGDMLDPATELGGPYDAVLLFDVLHHLTEAQIEALLARIRAALPPGGTLAVLDLFRTNGRGPGGGNLAARAARRLLGPRRPRASAAFLGLFFHLTSGADLPEARRFARQLAAAGFAPPRRARVRRLPDQRLYLARAL
jgi:SAM-dependent methyltransferase